MPRRRRELSIEETSTDRAARLELEEMIAESERAALAQPGMTSEKLEQEREKGARRDEKQRAKAYAAWDAAAPSWRETEGQTLLEDRQRYDRAAKLPADGGRDWYAFTAWVEHLLRKGGPRPKAAE